MEFTGKSSQEAVELGLKELGVSKLKLLTKPKKVFLVKLKNSLQ